MFGKGQVYEGMSEFLKSFGADDRQGFFPFGDKIMIQEDKGQSEAMIPVKMADKDVLDILQRFFSSRRAGRVVGVASKRIRPSTRKLP